MKDRLLELIEKTDEIEKLFHKSDGALARDVIYDRQEFCIWIQELKFELQEIYDRTRNKSIWNSINDLSATFNGWDDRNKFDKIKGDLIAIKRGIDSYYPVKKLIDNKNENEVKNMPKKPKIFISHSSKDKEYVEKIVALLDVMGLNDSQVFCSSLPGYDIPIDKDIFDYLRELFQGFDLHIIIIHSPNYYSSTVSMNEMGAAWVLKNKCTSILLPGFVFSDMKGVVNGNTISIKLDNAVDEVKDKLNQLYEQLVQEFNLRRKNNIIWERKRDDFIKNINNVESQPAKVSVHVVKDEKIILSQEAEEILKNAASSKEALIFISSDLSSGKCIQAGSKSYSASMGAREFSKWDTAFDELLKVRYIKSLGAKNEIFQVTNEGFKYLEAKEQIGE